MQVAKQEYFELIDRFIQTANGLKDEGKDINLIANALMEASVIYATFVATGNKGYLNDSGISKLVGAYRHVANRVQKSRKEAAENAQPEAASET